MSDSVVGTIIENILETTKFTQDKVKINSRKDEIGRSINLFLNEYDSNRKEILDILKSRSEKGKLNIIDEKGNIDIQKIAKVISYENKRIENIKKVEADIPDNSSNSINTTNVNDIMESYMSLQTFEEKSDWMKENLGFDFDGFSPEKQRTIVKNMDVMTEYEIKLKAIYDKYKDDRQNPSLKKEIEAVFQEYTRMYPQIPEEAFQVKCNENGNPIVEDKIQCNAGEVKDESIGITCRLKELYAQEMNGSITPENKALIPILEQKLKNNNNKLGIMLNTSEYEYKSKIAKEVDKLNSLEIKIIDNDPIFTGEPAQEQEEVGIFEDEFPDEEIEKDENEVEKLSIPLTTKEGDEALERNGEELDASGIEALEMEAVSNDGELKKEPSQEPNNARMFVDNSYNPMSNSKKEPNVVKVEEIFTEDERYTEQVVDRPKEIKEEPQTQLALYKPRFTDRIRGFISDIKNVGVMEAFNKNFISDDVQIQNTNASNKEDGQLKGIRSEQSQNNLAQEENIKKQTLLTKMKDALKKAFGIKDETAEKIAQETNEKSENNADSKEENGGFDFNSPNEELMAKTAAVGKDAAAKLKNSKDATTVSTAGPVVDAEERDD